MFQFKHISFYMLVFIFVEWEMENAIKQLFTELRQQWVKWIATKCKSKQINNKYLILFQFIS